MIICRPIDKNIDNITTQRKIKDIINPVKLNIGIKRVKNISNGGILFECQTAEECDKIAKVIESKAKSTHTCDKPKLKNPQIIIYNVREEIKEEDLIKTIVTQNLHINNFMQSMDGEQQKTHLSIKRTLRKKKSNRL